MKKELLSKLLFIIVKSRFVYISRLMFYFIAKLHPYIEPLGSSRANVLKSLSGDDCQKIVLSGTGCLMIFLPTTIYKIPLSSHTSSSLFEEYKNHSEIRNSKLFEMVNYDINKIEVGSVEYYEMPKLESYETNNDIPIDETLDGLQSVNNGEGSLLSLDQQSKGLEILLKYATLDQIKELKAISDSLMSKFLPLCAMHGDLTPLNILRIKSSPMLIDLDRFSFVGFSHVDRLHYVIEAEAKANKVNSYSQMLIIQDKLLSGFSPYEVMSYLFYRVGAEIRNSVVRKDEYYFRIIKVILQYNTNKN